jgi:hypothetical protein
LFINIFLSTDIEKAALARQRLMTQLTENELVKTELAKLE